MSQYRVSAARAPSLDDGEARRRLARAYAIILQSACEYQAQETADRGEFGDLTRTAASDAPGKEPEATDGL